MAVPDFKIPAVTPRKQYYAAANQTDFTIPFRFFENVDIKVYIEQNTSPEDDSTYTITGAGTNADGTLSFNDGLDEDTLVTIARESTVDRLVNFMNSGDWTAQNVNDQFNRQVTFIQEIYLKAIDMAVRLPITSPLTSLNFPAGGPGFENRVIGFNATGDDLTIGPSFQEIVDATGSASASAIAAANSASAANTTYNNTLTVYNNTSAVYLAFDKRNLGVKAADPTVDNQGDPLLEGAQYWNTTNKVWRTFNGTVWQNAVVPAAGSVLNSMLADMAQGTIKGRFISGAGAPEDLTPSQARETIQALSLLGRTDGLPSATGNVGELLSAVRLSASAISLTSNVASNVQSLTLPPGSWLVFGGVTFFNGSGISVTASAADADLTSATLAVEVPPSRSSAIFGASTVAANRSHPVGARVHNVSTNTTIYLVALATFSGGAVTAYGTLYALRIPTS